MRSVRTSRSSTNTDTGSEPCPGIVADGGHVTAVAGEGAKDEDDNDTCSNGERCCDGPDGEGLPCVAWYMSAGLDHYPENAVAATVADTSDDTSRDGGAGE